MRLVRPEGEASEHRATVQRVIVPEREWWDQDTGIAVTVPPIVVWRVFCEEHHAGTQAQIMLEMLRSDSEGQMREILRVQCQLTMTELCGAFVPQLTAPDYAVVIDRGTE